MRWKKNCCSANKEIYIPFHRWLAATSPVSSPRSPHLQTDPKLLCFPLPFSAIDPTIRFVEKGFSSSLSSAERDANILSLSFRFSAEIYICWFWHILDSLHFCGMYMQYFLEVAKCARTPMPVQYFAFYLARRKEKREKQNKEPFNVCQ